MSEKEFNRPRFSAEQKKEILRASLILFAICAVCVLLLIGTNMLISQFVDDSIAAPVRAVMERLLPADEYSPVEFDFEESNGVSAVYEASSGEDFLGYCVETTAADYDGEMTAIVVVDADAKVAAVEIVSMPEGVGTKVKNSAFLSQFVSKSGKLTAVKSAPKDDSQIAAISGATASSNAVTECVNHALSAVSQISAEKAKEGENA